MSTSYNHEFYRNYADESRQSAAVIVPLVCELVRPAVVIDIGCGIGAWLGVFLQQGVSEVTGVDGDYVDRALLQFPAGRFIPHDLALPLPLRAQFDLAVSLEVAEHLPEHLAGQFVSNLTGLAPVVLFSAAIPHQGGDEHVNEQWPEYWIALFEQRGYLVIDCIRDQVWSDEAVAYYYAQNALLFVRKDRLDDYPLLKREVVQARTSAYARVHPRKWLEASDPRRQPLPPLLRALPSAVHRAFFRRLRRLARWKTP